MVFDTLFDREQMEGVPAGLSGSGEISSSALMADMFTTLNKTEPTLFSEGLIRKTWLDVDKQPSNWPTLKARYGINDDHLMNLAHEGVGNHSSEDGLFQKLKVQSGENTPAAPAGGEEAQPYVPDGSASFPKVSPITGSVDPDKKGRINSVIPPMGYVGATPPGQFADGFTRMPGNGSHPYDGMNSWQYAGRLTGEHLPGWDSGRQAYEAAKSIYEKRERGEPITDNDIKELGGYGLKAAGEIAEVLAVGGIAKKGAGAVVNRLRK